MEAGLGDRGAAVVWRCSMGRDKHAAFAAVKRRLFDARMGMPQCSGNACRGSMVAVESDAATLPEIVREMLIARTSERSGRLIDHDDSASMEKKKREGYF